MTGQAVDAGSAIVAEYARRWPTADPATDPATAARWKRTLSTTSLDAAWVVLRTFTEAPTLATLTRACAIEEVAQIQWTPDMLVTAARISRTAIAV